MITSSQIKAARAMTGLTVRAFAEKAEIAFSTMVRLESAGNEIPAGWSIEAADFVNRVIKSFNFSCFNVKLRID